MIVRTYGRRNRCVGRGFSEDEDLLGQSQDSSDAFSDIPPPPSSQDQDSSSSAPWSLDPHLSYWADSDSRPLALLDHAPAPAPARPKRCSRHMPPTSTLMEAQEFGEMMEHVDEVNFAVDGLRRGLPASVRRSSLLSLLSISFTSQHRRLLRAQGYRRLLAFLFQIPSLLRKKILGNEFLNGCEFDQIIHFEVSTLMDFFSD